MENQKDKTVINELYELRRQIGQAAVQIHELKDVHEKLFKAYQNIDAAVKLLQEHIDFIEALR